MLAALCALFAISCNKDDEPGANARVTFRIGYLCFLAKKC